jgi:hypothetical protein
MAERFAAHAAGRNDAIARGHRGREFSSSSKRSFIHHGYAFVFSFDATVRERLEANCLKRMPRRHH